MGPLQGLRIVEFVGIGPGPFTATAFADMGAEVLRIDRTTPSGLGIETETRFNTTARGRPSLAVDLKSADGAALALELIAGADGLIEGFRPGVMERLGLGPEPCLERNPKLVYGRITGWGQDGPLAPTAGHDINYIALAGALGQIGPAGGRPLPPLNLVGDYGGGAMFLAFGMLSALFEASRSGRGQVVDAAMFEGAAYLMLPLFGWFASGQWRNERGGNLLDGGCPWYDTYETADGRHVSIGAIEPKFYANLLAALELDPAELPEQNDRDGWPVLRERFESAFRARSLAQWCERLTHAEACFAPVLYPGELEADPHHQARGSLIEIDGVPQPAPAPRFSRSRPETPTAPVAPGHGGAAALDAWGIAAERVDALRKQGVIRCE
jgi:alpha-methylacyl-CoA racemase